MRYNFRVAFCIIVLLLVSLAVHAQTFFEAADGTGVLAFRNKKTSQIRFNLTEKLLTYGYYYSDSSIINPKKRLMSIEVKLKPNDDGIATLIEKNKLQPGFQLNGSYGLRFRRGFFRNRFDILDIYLKAEYKLNNLTIYDSTQLGIAQEPISNSLKSTGDIKLILNYVISIGKANIWLGVESGYQRGNNLGDLSDIQIQNTNNYPNDSTRIITFDIKEAKKGPLQSVNKIPLNVDFIFDPQIKPKIFGIDKTDITPALFGYLRTDMKYQPEKYKLGIGICFLNEKNPSKVITSIGYQLPIFGNGIGQEKTKEDKGIFFASIGFSFL